MGLREYRKKRDFGRTPEPAGTEHASKRRALATVTARFFFARSGRNPTGPNGRANGTGSRSAVRPE